MRIFASITPPAPQRFWYSALNLVIISFVFVVLCGCDSEPSVHAIVTPMPEVKPTSTPDVGITLTPVGPEGDWTLVFSDEFDGSELDTDKWTTCYWWNDEGCTIDSNHELQWYTPDSVLVENGTLRLRAQERTIEANDRKIYNYISGMVTTGPPNYKNEPARFVFRYGYAEIRAKVPSGQGLWPAFWLLPDNFTSKPEIDVLEILGHETGVLHMNFHYLDENKDTQRAPHDWTGYDLSTDWHLYAIEWAPDALIWYLDGVEVWRFDETDYIPDETLYLLLNLAVGGDWPGSPDSSTVFPAYYDIDYVRVWQQQEEFVLHPPGSSVLPVGKQGEWEMVFNDEFEGSELDTDRWSTCYWWANDGCTNEGSGDLQWYLPDNILLEDGILHLRALEQTIDASNGNTYDYTAGMISTGPPDYKNVPSKFAFTYGYIEVKAQIPAGDGLLTAFWLLSDDFNSKPSIEGAIIYGHEPDVLNMSVNYLDTDDESQRVKQTWAGPDLSADWHVYGVEWTPSIVIWYVDGTERWRFEEPDGIPAQPLYLLFTLALRQIDSLDTTGLPADYKIDYVRVWQKPGN